MGVTRRAARLCFAALLIGAGAAAVAAKPSGQGPPAMVEIVPGDPRLDLEWALVQSGMPVDEAKRVSVLLVDQVDPRAEREIVNNLWSAELWWHDPSADAKSGDRIRMMRTFLSFRTGATLWKLSMAAGEDCPIGSQRFFPMRVASSRVPPIPNGTTVLVRLSELRQCGKGAGADDRDLEPIGPESKHGRTLVLCEPVTEDPESGLEVPTEFAVQK